MQSRLRDISAGGLTLCRQHFLFHRRPLPAKSVSMNPSLRCLLVATSAAFLAGACHREDMHVALQPRDQPAEPAPAPADSGPASAPTADAEAAAPMPRPHPHFTWKL